ncbi:rnd family efflux transporter mfp subunit [Leptolyngbya sp. Heron Island J]|uniref:efflux RND transporter periplasmic adaptor subunit n=1 Tax=Leptolyngbya sp. Heron Island J TaxID=1385935 RepID=UPI0003B9948F|nr:efflux RND transporter periplasmic adaptor subunit [Leptolyngbya sp. Heron Island J]ESA32975.1 rnd family efflux transporter mfp subunit [Leptolyngbya sp. Heron Island J]
MIGIPRVKERIASSAEEPIAQTDRILPVETLTVTPVNRYSVSRTYTGEIASLRASELGFERSGQLVEVLVDEGNVVETGAPLARLDIRNLQTQRQQLLAEKARANAQLAELQAGARSEDIAAAAAAVRDLEEQLRLQQVQRSRRESLYTQGAISREELDEFSFGEGALQARLDQSRSQLQELQNGTRPEQVMAQQALVQQLDATIADLDVTIAKSTLRAPFTGVISTKQVDEGTVVGAGQSVIRLLESATPEARVGMPISAIDQLNIGDEKTVYLGERSYSATVSSILPEVDAQTRTQTVVLALESAAASQANSGQTVRLNLQESIPTEGMWLPTEALTQGIRGLWTSYVLVPEENADGERYTVQPQSVEILYQDSDRVLVRGTLQPNDVVVASGPHRLVPGQLVTPAQ